MRRRLISGGGIDAAQLFSLYKSKVYLSTNGFLPLVVVAERDNHQVSRHLYIPIGWVRPEDELSPVMVSSTGASASGFASLIAFLNQESMNAGKSPVGFLNPLIYSAAGTAAFNDIIGGVSTTCNQAGFPAMPGWDPISGLGTPDYDELRRLVGLE